MTWKYRDYRFYRCCVCKQVTEARETSEILRRVIISEQGWKTTSPSSPNAKFICPECSIKHTHYAPGVRFKSVVLAQLTPCVASRIGARPRCTPGPKAGGLL